MFKLSISSPKIRINNQRPDPKSRRIKELPLVCTFRRSEGKQGTKSDDGAAASTKSVMSQQQEDAARDYKKDFHKNKRKMRCYYHADKKICTNYKVGGIIKERWLLLITPPQHILLSTCAHVHALGFDVVKAPGKPKKNTPHELLYVSLASFVQI
jgi:hypothetical protein